MRINSLIIALPVVQAMHKWFHTGNIIIAVLMVVFIVGSYNTVTPFQLSPAWSIGGIPIVLFWGIVWILYAFVMPLVLHKVEEK